MEHLEATYYYHRQIEMMPPSLFERIAKVHEVPRQRCERVDSQGTPSTPIGAASLILDALAAT